MVSQKKKERKKKKEKPSEPSSSSNDKLASVDIIASRKNLSNVRVIQRNLVYVTNLALSVAKEEVCPPHGNKKNLPDYSFRSSESTSTLANTEKFRK